MSKLKEIRALKALVKPKVSVKFVMNRQEVDEKDTATLWVVFTVKKQNNNTPNIHANQQLAVASH